MRPYDQTMDDAYHEAQSAQALVRSRRNKLEARAALHPRDPDALEPEEVEELESLKEWEP